MGTVRKLTFTHDFIVDELVKDPAVDRRFLAQKFRVAESTISKLLTSESFRERLAQRKAELSDPMLVKTVEERLRALADYSLQLLTETLDNEPTPHLLLETARMSTRALAESAAANRTHMMQNNFVVMMPGKAASSDEWAKAYQPEAITQIDKE